MIFQYVTVKVLPTFPTLSPRGGRVGLGTITYRSEKRRNNKKMRRKKVRGPEVGGNQTRAGVGQELGFNGPPKLGRTPIES